jgi:alkylation response protein AidB-like acyl-CoA dehydrogenase
MADFFVVAARTGEGLTQFLVPAATAGVTVTPADSLDLGRRYATVSFADVELSPSALIGPVGGARPDVEHGLALACVLQVAETCGVVSRVFELTLEYLDNRFSFGRSLSSYQALKHRVADMKIRLEASLGLATAAAHAVQDDTTDAAATVSAAKSYVGEAATDIIQDCVQLHGGIGVTWEHDLHLYLRRVTLDRNLFGTPAQHRERIAEELITKHAHVEVTGA